MRIETPPLLLLLLLGDPVGGKKLVESALKLNPQFDVQGAAEAEKLLRESDAGTK